MDGNTYSYPKVDAALAEIYFQQRPLVLNTQVTTESIPV